MKAMVLAAGRGERMRPLTDHLPKPLLPVAGKPLLLHHLERLADAGFTDVVINVAYLGEQIVARFGDGRALGLRIAWSREDEPLETAGGVAKARPLLGEAPFLLVNADVWTDIDLPRLRRRVLAPALSHLVLTRNPPQHPEGDFSLEAGRVGNGPGPRYTYTGIALVAPALVDGIAPGTKAPLAPLWRAAAAQGRVTGELHSGAWDDIGTPGRLSALEQRLRHP